MNNEMTVFSSEEFGDVRTVIIDNEPWFVGRDVCEAFNDTNYRRSLANIDDEDKGVSQMYTPGGIQNMIIINESGLYSLLFQMQPKKAKGVSQNEELIKQRVEKIHKFKRWVTSEVIPSIRKHGAYMTNEVIERTLTDPDYLIQLATTLKEERQARLLAEEKIKKQKPLVDFAKQVSDTDDLIDMKTMAKLLKDKNLNIGRNRLFDLLRVKKILMSDNQPYQKYVDAGYFKVNEYTYKTTLGNIKINRQTFVTGKGQIYIMKKVKEFMLGEAS